ncbi:MAG: hypothetical protein JWM87_1463 [Candidatus Eremiobacteraeota bacterium]|nr:hypothetical protein [Candidatus Eremiobacteraeota bacterium]
MASSQDHVDSSTNGAVPVTADEVRYATTNLGVAAVTASAADRRANDDRMTKLFKRVAHFNDKCDDARTELDDALGRQEGLQEHARGWPLLMVLLLGALSVALEYYPASLFTLVFQAKDNEHVALTWIFTAIGVILALVLGELLRRTRVPERPHTIDNVFVGVVGLLALAFLYFGYVLRAAYTAAQGGRLIPGLTAQQEALALTAVATIGILLTLITAYYRESIESFFVGIRIRRLRGELQMYETNKKKNQADLDRVIDAARTAGDRAAERNSLRQRRLAERATAEQRALADQLIAQRALAEQTAARMAKVTTQTEPEAAKTGSDGVEHKTQ